ncbi:hypothetical protein M0R45_030847 [Rubus argutus]|uniref:Uncharacterized protein n=1 Tax=Rubus argutus TaxID=59490 RepID=A0AAW1WGC2_RUBAR
MRESSVWAGVRLNADSGTGSCIGDAVPTEKRRGSSVGSIKVAARRGRGKAAQARLHGVVGFWAMGRGLWILARAVDRSERRRPRSGQSTRET